MIEADIADFEALLEALREDVDERYVIDVLERRRRGAGRRHASGRAAHRPGANLRVPFAALTSREFQALRRVHQRVKEMVGKPPFVLHLGKRKAEAQSYEDLRVQIVELAKEGIQLQRFKGLGEMNPDQLWETTMNPMTRTLSWWAWKTPWPPKRSSRMLMGDKVEPRREFIEKNAKEVRFLDV